MANKQTDMKTLIAIRREYCSLLKQLNKPHRGGNAEQQKTRRYLVMKIKTREYSVSRSLSYSERKANRLGYTLNSESITIETEIMKDLKNKVSLLASRVEGTESTSQVKKKLRASQPPHNAQFLLYLFLDKKNRDDGLGDAVENYGRHVKMFGKRKAKILFYQQVALTAWPFLRRVAAKAGGLFLLGKWLRKFIS